MHVVNLYISLMQWMLKSFSILRVYAVDMMMTFTEVSWWSLSYSQNMSFS